MWPVEPQITTLGTGTVTYRFPSPSTARAIVILQHGFGDYMQRWMIEYPFMLQDLHALSVDVYAMDLQGHGGSPGQRSIVNVSDAIQDHIALRQEIAKTNPLPTYLLGHSLGGLVVAGSASQDADNLAGVILVAPALADPMTPLARSCIRTVARVIPTWQIPRKQSSVDGLTKDKGLIGRWNADKNIFHGQISFLLASSALEVAVSLWQRVEQWSIPTLVIHGDQDTYTEHAQSRRFVEAIKSDDKEFASIIGGLHDLVSDDPENWRHIVAWIKQRI